MKGSFNHNSIKSEPLSPVFMDRVKKELLEFCQSTEKRMLRKKIFFLDKEYPDLNGNERKFIHNQCALLGLQSQSHGGSIELYCVISRK